MYKIFHINLFLPDNTCMCVECFITDKVKYLQKFQSYSDFSAGVHIFSLNKTVCLNLSRTNDLNMTQILI